MKLQGQKSLALDTAIGMWQLLFAEKQWPFVDHWCQFLQVSQRKYLDRCYVSLKLQQKEYWIVANCCMGSLVSIQCHLRHGSFCMITLYWMFEVEDLKLCLILRVLILLCNPSRDIWVMPTIEVRFNIICRCYGSVQVFLFFGVSGWAYC